MKSNIALIGFMGTGKTAVGKILAKKLNWRLIEMDSTIERMAGKSISDIFNQDGEIVFRELEIEAVKKVARGKKQIIACGGGVVLNAINIDRLRQTCIIINLSASPEVILQRTIQNIEQRPLLNVDDPASRIRELMKFRKPLYERGADITIKTSKSDVNSIAEKIIRKLKSNAGFSLQQ